MEYFESTTRDVKWSFPDELVDTRMFSSSEKFSISYETREKEEYSSKKFIENILHTESVNNKNIDFYHISKAFLTIKKWFEDNNINKADFLNALLKVDYRDDKDIANNVTPLYSLVNLCI